MKSTTARNSTQRPTRRRQAVRLSCALHRDGPFHIAQCLEVPASACGRSAEQALSRLKDALGVYFADGGPLPSYERPSVEFIDVAVRTSPSRRGG